MCDAWNYRRRLAIYGSRGVVAPDDRYDAYVLPYRTVITDPANPANSTDPSETNFSSDDESKTGSATGNDASATAPQTEDSTHYMMGTITAGALLAIPLIKKRRSIIHIFHSSRASATHFIFPRKYSAHCPVRKAFTVRIAPPFST